MKKQKLVHKCPACQTEIQWTKENSYRPFCSARCKNKDYLGWANEENRIQSEPSEQWSEE